MPIFLLFLFISALLAAPVAAQPKPAALNPDQEAALYGSPILATAAGLYLGLRSEERLGAYAWVPFALLPFVSGAAVCGAGALTDIPGSCRNAIVWGVRGALPGYAAVGLGFFLGADVFKDDAAVLLVLVGFVSAIAVPPFAAIAGYRKGTFAVTPTVVTDPATSRTALGLHLILSL